MRRDITRRRILPIDVMPLPLRPSDPVVSRPSALLSRPSCRFALALLIGAIAALLCVAIGTPLPWMIGPLFATAGLRMAGVPLHCPVPAREAGQWVIGTALGLYFTPVVIGVLMSKAAFIVLGVVFALLLGAGCAWLLRRLTGIDAVTAFFAMAIGGASEMAVQGERHGALVDRVAAAHSLRLMMVVAILPFAFQLSGVKGLDPYSPAASIVHAGGLMLLVALTSVAALCLRRIGAPNAWVIGPLLMTIGLTANGYNFSALPGWMIAGGQLLIGISLGTRFTPAFLRTAPRFLGGVAICTLAAIIVAAGFGLLVAWLSGMHVATAILATSPGGIAEMSLTAKTLELGVPIVTAFHVTRMATLVLTIAPLFRLFQRA